MIIILNVEHDVTVEGKELPFTEIEMKHLILGEQIQALDPNGIILVMKGQEFVIVAGGFVGPFDNSDLPKLLRKVRR